MRLTFEGWLFLYCWELSCHHVNWPGLPPSETQGKKRKALLTSEGHRHISVALLDNSAPTNLAQIKTAQLTHRFVGEKSCSFKLPIFEVVCYATKVNLNTLFLTSLYIKSCRIKSCLIRVNYINI